MKTLHFLAIVVTALALVPGGAHLLELANKMQLERDPYFVVQAIYNGWWMVGFVLLAAIALNLIVALVRWRNPQAFRLSLAAFLFLAATLGVFFGITEPANQATQYWTAIPEDWQELRARWEYSHAVNALLTLIAFCCTVGAGLAGWSPALERAERQRLRELQREMKREFEPA
jgi:hypothetical protein